MRHKPPIVVHSIAIAIAFFKSASTAFPKFKNTLGPLSNGSLASVPNLILNFNTYFMNKFTCLAVLMACLTACKTIIVQHEQQTKTTQNLQLGSIGEQRGSLIFADYNHTALPTYKQPLKLKVTVVPYSKASYKAFETATHAQQPSQQLQSTDSVQQRPQYLKIEIADRVGLIHSLNSSHNSSVFQFLKQKPTAHIVSTIAVAFSPAVMAQLSSAQEVFLEQTGQHNYILKTYNPGNESQSVFFNQGVVFGYKASKVCWTLTTKRRYTIVDIVESDENCPYCTHSRIKALKSRTNSYKRSL
tara:strand:+ start:191 stop:1093 length:903 start_codon:yes stop_codon:yes gene_type:complete